MPSSPSSKNKMDSSYFTKSPSKQTVNLAKRTATAVSNAASKSLSISSDTSSFSSLSLDNRDNCTRQSKSIQSPLKKKIKLDEKADESDIFNDDLFEILGAYDTNHKIKPSKLKQQSDAVKVDEEKQHLTSKPSSGNILTEDNFPPYLFYVVDVEIVENENNYIHIRLKKVDGNFKINKKSKEKEENEKCKYSNDDSSIISCYLYDSW